LSVSLMTHAWYIYTSCFIQFWITLFCTKVLEELLTEKGNCFQCLLLFIFIFIIITEVNIDWEETMTSHS
jgi:hypothetical protein